MPTSTASSLRGYSKTQGGFEWIDYGLIVLDARRRRARSPTTSRPTWRICCRALSGEGRLAGFEVKERFYEIGSPSGLAELEAFLGS